MTPGKVIKGFLNKLRNKFKEEKGQGNIAQSFLIEKALH